MINPLSVDHDYCLIGRSNHCNFRQFEVVDRGSETQPQVVENLNLLCNDLLDTVADVHMIRNDRYALRYVTASTLCLSVINIQ